jgi:hypothetical protein
MTFNDLKEYLNDAGQRYGYVGTFDDCRLMFNTRTCTGLVTVQSAQITIGTDGFAHIVLSDEEPNGDLG